MKKEVIIPKGKESDFIKKLQREKIKLEDKIRTFTFKTEKLEIQVIKLSVKLEKQELQCIKQKNKLEEKIVKFEAEIKKQNISPESFHVFDLAKYKTEIAKEE